MRQLLLVGAMMIAAETCAFAQSGFWVVGDSAAGKCEIVTSNPVINSQVGGNITFGSGPYKSMDDAKLARSNISECPAVPEPPAEQPPEEGKSD